MQLDLTALRKAIAQLEEALEYSNSKLASEDARLALHLRAGAIQAFEFTFELTVKLIRRLLTVTETDPAAVAELSFNELIRLASERGLLHASLVEWKEFRKDRDTTSHTYDEAKALDVFEAIPGFLGEARFVLAALEQRQGRE